MLYPETLEAVTKGLAIDAPGPHVSGLHIVGGEVALLQGRWLGALEEFRVAIPTVPDDHLLQPRALHGVYLAAKNYGNKTLATKYRTKLTSSFPNWKPALTIDSE